MYIKYAIIRLWLSCHIGSTLSSIKWHRFSSTYWMAIASLFYFISVSWIVLGYAYSKNPLCILSNHHWNSGRRGWLYNERAEEVSKRKLNCPRCFALRSRNFPGSFWQTGTHCLAIIVLLKSVGWLRYLEVGGRRLRYLEVVGRFVRYLEVDVKFTVFGVAMNEVGSCRKVVINVQKLAQDPITGKLRHWLSREKVKISSWMVVFVCKKGNWESKRIV